jgi:hypothetical protein
LRTKEDLKSNIIAASNLEAIKAIVEEFKNGGNSPLKEQSQNPFGGRGMPVNRGAVRGAPRGRGGPRFAMPTRFAAPSDPFNSFEFEQD